MQCSGWDLIKLTDYVCEILEVRKESLRQKGRGNILSKAKSMIAYWGYVDLGKKGTEIARHLAINQSSTSYLIKIGEKAVRGKSLFDYSNSGP